MENSQQAASLARRMAGKKGQSTQLQVEVNNEEDWEKLLAREGLIVVDVYSDWSGPCVGMIGNLKKAKVDFGGEALHLAIAKSDEIETLARFRNKSEPTWLFAAGGQLVTVTFGANAPKLMKMIDAEVKQEIRVLKGETWRRSVPFDQLCEEEKERLEAAAKLKSEAERQEIERIENEKQEKRLKLYRQMAEFLFYETVVVCFPHTLDPDFGCVMTTELDLLWRSQMMYVVTQSKVVITPEIFEEIFFMGGIERNDYLMEDLASGPCLVLLLRCQIIVAPGQEGEKHAGNIEKELCSALNKVPVEPDQDVVTPDPDSIPAKYMYVKKTKIEIAPPAAPVRPQPEEEHEEDEEGEEAEEQEEEKVKEVYEVFEEPTTVPGCWTPSSYITKCAAVKYLFPARAEKLIVVEEPPTPPKVVLAFETFKQKECFDLAEEYENDVLNIGYFSSMDPETAEHLCANQTQYAKLTHNDSHKLIIVVKKMKSEPLLSFAGLGAVYASLDENLGKAEADLFFPPGVEPKFTRLEEAENMLQQEVVEEPEEIVNEEEEEEEAEEDDEDDLMALLGVTAD